MFTREQLEELITSMRGKLDETNSALLSEDFLSIISNYVLALDEIATLNNQIDELKTTNDELLKTNGKLFQQIGVQTNNAETETTEETDTSDEISIEDAVNEKGELI